jgi:ribonuclease HI
MHTKLLQQIVTLVQVSPNLIHFYKVKAHAGIAGNKFADSIAKQQAYTIMTTLLMYSHLC